MIYRTTPFNEDTDVAGILSNDGSTGGSDYLPKVVFEADGTYQVLNNSTQQTGYTPSGTETRILYPSQDLGIEFGADYGVIVFLSRAANYVFRAPLTAPVLTLTENAGVPDLEWTSSFSIPTKIYRTAVYPSGDPQPSEYTLIAEVDGYTTSGGTSTYTDSGITLTSGDSIDYFVVNDNGTSAIETVSVV